MDFFNRFELMSKTGDADLRKHCRAVLVSFSMADEDDSPIEVDIFDSQ